MADGGTREARLQAVQDGLIRNLARQSDIARVDRGIGGAHQRAAPMRRRAGEMGDRRQPHQEIGHVFMGIRQDQRRMTQQRP